MSNRLLVGWLFLVLSLFGLSCRGCGTVDVLATLQEKSGAVDRDFSRSVKNWKVAELGARLLLGDGIQTRTDTTAQLKLADGSILLMQPDTIVRFAKRPPGEQEVGFDVEFGGVSLQVGSKGLKLVTSLGAVRIESGSSLLLSNSDKGLRLVVELGRVVLGDTAVEQGEAIVIEMGGVVIQSPTALPVAAEALPDPVPDLMPDQRSLQIVGARVVGYNAEVKGPTGWTRLEEGTTQIQVGTELKLGDGTEVQLQREQRTASLTRRGQYIVAPKPGVLVSTAMGSIMVGGATRVRIEVPGGVLTVAPSGRASLKTTTRGTQIDVQSAQLELRAKGGAARTIFAGQGALLDSGGSVVLQGVGLEAADMNLVVGESVEIHDPVPPVAIRFRYENRCPHVGVLELIRDNRVVQYAAAAGIVSLALARGSFGYRLRCLKEEGELSKVVSRGKINVFADRATRKLGARAPITKLQTDGRSYTVLYQNRLPEVEVSWPTGPDGDSYQLVHSFDRKETTMALDSASYGFASGKLKEGKHVFYFEAGGKLSRRSTVTIAFDNASPAARLTTPATMSMLPGEKVRIAGIALPGSKVSVGEKRVGVGSQGRFSVAAAVPSDLRAIAVNIRHPRLGNHIYLRRVVTR